MSMSASKSASKSPSMSANPLLGFVEFERRVMSAKALDEFGFIAVNDLRRLISYRQAIYWRHDKGIMAISGVVEIASQSPYILFLHDFFKVLPIRERAEVTPISPGSLPKKLADQWGEWFAANLYLLPLSTGTLLLSRSEALSDAEKVILEQVRLPLSVTEKALGRRHYPMAVGQGKRRWKWLAACAAIALLFAIPIRDSVLASSVMVARKPAVIRSPMEGVIDEILVEPNEAVKKDEPLFSLDLTNLSGKLAVALQEQATAEAQYKEMAQAQLFDAKAKVQVALLKAKVSEKAATVDYLRNLIAKGRVLAPQDGVAVFDDATDWIGRPVRVGEKVMQLAEPLDTEIESWVDLADIGTVRTGAPLSLFLNTDPLNPLKAEVTTVAYEATPRADGSMQYRIRAKAQEGQPSQRMGLKGVARISGDHIALGWWLLRKPVIFIRQRTGL